MLRAINSMRTTCRLVKIRIWSYIEPIRECVRKNSLICKFVMHRYQTCFMIGLTNDQITILTNHIWCKKASSAQGLNINAEQSIISTSLAECRFNTCHTFYFMFCGSICAAGFGIIFEKQMNNTLTLHPVCGGWTYSF